MRWLRLTVALLAATVFFAPAVVAYAQPKKADAAKVEKAKPISDDEAAAGGFMCMGLGGISLVLAGLAVLVGALVYFAPTFIAFYRGHPNLAPILVVNLLLGGCLGIGWVVALAWSVSAFDPPRRRAGSASDDNNPFA